MPKKARITLGRSLVDVIVRRQLEIFLELPAARTT